MSDADAEVPRHPYPIPCGFAAVLERAAEQEAAAPCHASDGGVGLAVKHHVEARAREQLKLGLASKPVVVLQHDGNHPAEVVRLHFVGQLAVAELGVGMAVFEAHAHQDAKGCLTQHVLTIVFQTIGKGHFSLLRCDVRHADAVALHRLAHQADAQGVVDPTAADGLVFVLPLGECRGAQQQCD